MRKTFLAAVTLAFLGPIAAASAQPVATPALDGRYEVTVTRTNAHRVFAPAAEVDVTAAGRIRLTLGGRTIRMARVGDLLYGRLPATSAGAVGVLAGTAALPAATVTLRIAGPDLLVGSVRSARESTRIAVRRRAAPPTATTTAIALAYWGAPAEPVRFFANEAAWRVWYDTTSALEGRWVFLKASGPTADAFVLGRDDLWNVEIEVTRATGDVVVTAEH